MGTRDGLLVIRNGLRAKRFADKVVAERSNVDFVLLGEGAKGQIAFVDCKAFQGSRFGRSMIDARQLALCSQYEKRGFAAGFVVLLREKDWVGFFSARLLLGGKTRQGFGPEHGLTLGSANNFHLRKIWGERLPPTV